MSKKFIRKLALGLGLTLLALVLSSYFILQTYIDDRSRGRVRLSLSGLSIQSTVYEKEGQTVLVLGLIHIADERFYRDLVDFIPKGQTIVLLEGVDGAEDIAGAALDYSRLARRLGVSYQDKIFDELVKSQHDFLYADIHAEELSPEARRFLELLGSMPSLSDKLKESVSEEFDQEAWERAEASFQRERNEKLLKTFDEVSPSYRTIAIPWGVLHQEEFDKALRDRGYQPKKNFEILAISPWN